MLNKLEILHKRLQVTCLSENKAQTLPGVGRTECVLYCTFKVDVIVVCCLKQGLPKWDLNCLFRLVFLVVECDLDAAVKN